MNIFFLDNDPKLAAQYQCDKHVVKMILESAQLLSTAYRVLDGKDLVLDGDKNNILYKATHINHPCAIWCRKTWGNYHWLSKHLEHLLNEYTFRYGKIHKCKSVYKELVMAPRCIDQEGKSKPPLCMPDEFKISDHPVISYREYYKIGKLHLHKWTKREKPQWI